MFGNILGSIMRFCYNLFNSYGLAIIVFTLISKVILLPISIWVQKNSIKMVKMQPDINKIKIKYFGDKERIAEEQSALFKKEKYNAFSSLIPLLIQIVLLMGLVEVINHPLTYILKTPENVTKEMVSIALENDSNLNADSSSLELSVVKDIKNGRNIEKYDAIEGIGDTISKSESLKLSFLGFDLSWVASIEKGMAIWVPIIAGLSALLLCIAQNMINVLQAEQSKFNQWGMLILSVGLSLYLGIFVPAGVALYWTISNLIAILQQWLLNIFINPKKFVNYNELEKTSKELKELENLQKSNKLSKEELKKEKEDYKRFFKVINKHLVFYSESNGFYKYYKGIIEYLLENTNITIHYITSDFNDKIFDLEKQNSQIKAYFITEKKLITMMMKMDADVVVMTMPDLENYHIKRSYVRKDIEYVYIPHAMDSLNLTMREGSTDHYDTVFATGKYQYEEYEKTNKVNNLPSRKIVKWGYSLLDDMLKDYEENKVSNKEKKILIAPSWQKDNIIDLCLDEILDNLSGKNYQVIVRPHPQQVRHEAEKFSRLKEKYKDVKNIIIQTDFSKNDTVFNSDILITDWSGIAYEFAFTTKKPVIFIDTPMKIMNPEYKKIDIEPYNIWVREKMGKVIKLDKLDSVSKVIEDMIKNEKVYKEKVSKLTLESVYNIGKSAEVGGDYIIEAINRKIEERSNKE